jgi:hypothetical protein
MTDTEASLRTLERDAEQIDDAVRGSSAEDFPGHHQARCSRLNARQERQSAGPPLQRSLSRPTRLSSMGNCLSNSRPWLLIGAGLVLAPAQANRSKVRASRGVTRGHLAKATHAATLRAG